ncbi:hypothetical protein EIM50_23675 [Pseudoxanthomonas sp. SGD-10]|nr:hypothetical protein EIM50_23675 [Pseudoxanthomonas sp. SGD-10]
MALILSIQIHMENSTQIYFNIMGDPAIRNATVRKSISENEVFYHIDMPNGKSIVMCYDKGEWIQTEGTPLDSNTLHSLRRALDKEFL